MKLMELDIPGPWGERHLLELERLTADQIMTVLNLADYFDKATRGGSDRLDVLRGMVVANLFFENSTRTRTSFSLAAKRADAKIFKIPIV